MTVPALVGPTAVGKTELSLLLATKLGAEIISVDSRQVYRGMDIGTAKVGTDARAAVPHHGLDLIDPDEAYSAGRFAREAREWIAQIRGRGKLPLLVGGTGFFLHTLAVPVFREPPVDPARRRRLREWLAGCAPDELSRWVDALDPDRSAEARAGGPQRLSRNLEIPLLTGRPLSWWHRNAPSEDDPVPLSPVLLERPREDLYRRIDERTRAMFEGGLLHEVRSLLEAGYTPDDPGMSATGYREAAAVISGELDAGEALDRVQRLSRGYARRQLTWFRNQLPPDTLRLDATRPVEEQSRAVENWLVRTRGEREG